MAFTTIPGSGATDATTFTGTTGVDVLTLLNQNNAIAGAQKAADTITFQNGDLLNNNLTLKGGQGNDVITSAANNTIANSLINGNKNNDTITIINSSSSSLFGGQGNDTFTMTAAGTVSNTLLNGNKGNDTINGTGGVSFAASSVFGGAGIDSINANQGATGSLIAGNDGVDTITVGGNLSGSTVNGNAGNDIMSYVAGAGATDFTADTKVFGGAGNDSITAATVGTQTFLSGDNGNDSLTGGTDANGDSINGGANNDSFDGNAGADQINVGTGTDRLIQDDEDTLQGLIANGTALTGADVITGLGTGDSIDLSAIANLTFANGALTSVGTTYLAAVANTARLVQGSYSSNAFTAGNAATDTDYLFQFSGGTAGGTVINTIVLDDVGAGAFTNATASAAEIITLA